MPQYDLFGNPTPLPGEPLDLSEIVPVIDLSIEGQATRLEKWLHTRPLLDRAKDEIVRKILIAVEDSGDAELLQAISFSNQRLISIPEELLVPPNLLGVHHQKMDRGFLAAIRLMVQNVSMFHIKQHNESWFVEDEETEVRIGQIMHPIESVGLLLPAGIHPEALITYAVPAKLAGVNRIVVAIPDEAGGINPEMAATLHELGLGEVLLLSGAHAVGVFAFGTNTFEPVDKIVGYNDEFSQIAKRQVSGRVGTDLVNPMRELVILADAEANPAFVAADIWAQCEYNALARALVFTSSESFIETLFEELTKQLDDLPNRTALLKILQHRFAIVEIHETAQAVPWINEIAPQYLHLICDEMEELIQKITKVGTILMGPHSPEAACSLFAGPHPLAPAARAARFLSPPGVDDFLCKTNVVHFSRATLEELQDAASNILNRQERPAHFKSIQIRLKTPVKEQADTDDFADETIAIAT